MKYKIKASYFDDHSIEEKIIGEFDCLEMANNFLKNCFPKASTESAPFEDCVGLRMEIDYE
jgi:hypothetical protein